MKTFVDNAGRTWTVSITVDTVRRVRSLTQVDILQAVEGNLMERLALDPVLLCDVLYAVCKPEAEKQGVTDVQFGEAMAGDAIDSATAALLEEIAEFFASRIRRPMKLAVEKQNRLHDALSRAALSRLEALDVEKTAESLLAKSGGSSGSTRAP